MYVQEIYIGSTGIEANLGGRDLMYEEATSHLLLGTQDQWERDEQDWEPRGSQGTSH